MREHDSGSLAVHSEVDNNGCVKEGFAYLIVVVLVDTLLFIAMHTRLPPYIR